MNYYCNQCKNTFDEPATYYESHSEQFSVCPYCGSDYYDEASRCQACKEPVPIGTELCEDCEKAMFSEFMGMASEIATKYGFEGTVDFLNYVYEWGGIL